MGQHGVQLTHLAASGSDGVAWLDVSLGIGGSLLGSLLVGIGLWLFLPRGAVLTKRPTDSALSGAQSWILRNESAVGVRILWVERADMASPEPEKVAPGDLLLSFEDERHDIAVDEGANWNHLILEPGDGVTVTIPTLNTNIVIRYRRDGWTGAGERRSIVLHTSA